jgi:hypothetical protein
MAMRKSSTSIGAISMQVLKQVPDVFGTARPGSARHRVRARLDPALGSSCFVPPPSNAGSLAAHKAVRPIARAADHVSGDADRDKRIGSGRGLGFDVTSPCLPLGVGLRLGAFFSWSIESVRGTGGGPERNVLAPRSLKGVAERRWVVPVFRKVGCISQLRE